MHNKLIRLSLMALAVFLSTACHKTPVPVATTEPTQTNEPVVEPANNNFKLDYEQFQLENGLTVILHQDKSDPIVAMATIVHVGSNREKPGKTGFAHFFEHMSFNDSENVPKGANRKMIPELGGTRNGGTWSDGTIYYEVVPKDAFDKLLWIDSDRLGFMINTVDQGTLEREKQVVKNEKRQRVDNRAYGHSGHVIKKALYPEGHPYNWTVIGDLKDLQAATLDDVREFYQQYYLPANATLVIAGDIDIAETRNKVEYWFGEIKGGVGSPDMTPQPVILDKDIRLFHLDNFAQLPELRITYPGVEQFHPDSYALNVLAKILSEGKNAALYQVVVEEQKLAPAATAFNNSEEIAGTFTLRVRANAGTRLDVVKQAVDAALVRFEEDGFSDNQLIKIKAEMETDFYYSIESVLDKALQMGIYNEYAGSVDFISKDIKNITAVSRTDILRVYRQYIRNKAAIITSFVPHNAPELVLSGSTKADVIEEQIQQGAEVKFVENDAIKYPHTMTKNDRSEPPLTILPVLEIPEIWQFTSSNGIPVNGIETNELPVVNFSLRINGGQSLDAKDKFGSATLLAQLMMEGTVSKTPQQLEEAIGLLGARINIRADREAITISARSLARNFDETLRLVTEMLISPRFDASEFQRLKASRLTAIEQTRGSPTQIASNAFKKLLYGNAHVSGTPLGGTRATVESINLDDLKLYYKKYITPDKASFHLVGAKSKLSTKAALKELTYWWGESPVIPTQSIQQDTLENRLFFIDFPKAKQSVIYVGKVATDSLSPDFYPLQFSNSRLGGGMSARLSQTLRIQKGYTYGAYSYIPSSIYQAPFTASSQVRTNVTLESLQIFKDLIGEYSASYTEDDLAVAKNMTIKANSRAFESINQLLGMLQNISKYHLANNYIASRQEYVANASLEQVHAIIDQYLQESEMIYVVVGDAKTQLAGLEKLGLGKPMLLDINAEVIK